jgi:RNA polymerase sigma-70 factor (ECF subfamily)
MSSGSQSTSPTLLGRIVARDQAAWNRLVHLYASLVLGCCRRAGLQDNDAADVYQEVFRSVALSIQTFRVTKQTGSFRAWLKTITRNKIIDHFRRLGRQPSAEGGSTAQSRLLELEDFQDTDSDNSDSHERRLLVEQALHLIRDQFEERTWQAFWRTAVLEQETRQVAEELEMTPTGVRVAKSRVLHRLRQDFGVLLE